jgi:fatty-acyl-CoA synthase
MLGYWDDKTKIGEVIDAAGSMHTGDLDSERYCNIVGRIKDMVILGGESLHPREIEEFLSTSEDPGSASLRGRRWEIR